MKQKKETFQSLMLLFGYSRNIDEVFSDFLKMCICAFSINPETKQSFYEDEYMEIIGKYKKPKETDIFPKLLACLITEMEENVTSPSGNDVLGNFFEMHITKGRGGQYFTPQHVCDFMASITGTEQEIDPLPEPLSVIDPACGSGRMLLSKRRILGPRHFYYGIDIDMRCVQMSIINLFLHGCFHAEVMCADALYPNDFHISYRTRVTPLGIEKITEKENSPLWNRYNSSFTSNKIKQEYKPFVDVTELFKDTEQLKLF